MVPSLGVLITRLRRTPSARSLELRPRPPTSRKPSVRSRALSGISSLLRRSD